MEESTQPQIASNNWSSLVVKSFVCGIVAAGCGWLGLTIFGKWKSKQRQATERLHVPDDLEDLSIVKGSSDNHPMGQSQSSTYGDYVPVSPSETCSLVQVEESTRREPHEWSITVNPHEDSASLRSLVKSACLSADEFLPYSHAPPLVASPKANTVFRTSPRLHGFSEAEYKQSMIGTLDQLYGASRPISTDEARTLVVLLEQKNASGALLKTLTACSNLAAFSVNQDLLREEGCLKVLLALVNEPNFSEATRIMLLQTVANMAVNATNLPILQAAIPSIIKDFLSGTGSELLKLTCLRALTNLTIEFDNSNVMDTWRIAIPALIERISRHDATMVIASLRLLVNISCSPDAVSLILASRAPDNFISLLAHDASEDILVRSLALLYHLISTVHTLGLTYKDLPAADRAPSPETFYSCVFGAKSISLVKLRMVALSQHRNTEIAEKAARILALCATTSSEHATGQW